MERTVVITGIGVLSPIAIGRDTYWDALIQGKTGFRPITLFDTSLFPIHIGGEITDFDPVTFLGKKGLRELDRSTRLVCSAAKLAIDDAGLEITDEKTNFIGVSIGTTFGSLHSISQFDRVGLTEGPRYVNPSHFPSTVINSPASQISIRNKIRGFNATMSTGFCATLDALSYAADFIKLKRASAVLAGGVEELCEETFLCFHTLGYLSGAEGSIPLCCPFDRRRDGTILSEGAAVLVLEDSTHALNRNTDILSVVKGYGNAFDPSVEGTSDESGKGLEKAITLALGDAALSINDIDYICSGANSTRSMDIRETRAIKKVFGSHASDIPVGSIKSMVGECFSASGGLSVAAAIGALRKGFVPPTVNYHEQDPECNLDYVPNRTIQKTIRNVLVTSSDPFGNNSAIVLGRYEE